MVFEIEEMEAKDLKIIVIVMDDKEIVMENEQV